MEARNKLESEAFLEELVRKHAIGIVTTHHLNLTVTANKTPGIIHGAMASDERKLFLRLLGTTGVGPSLAMNLLSTLTGERLVRAIREEDLATLTRVLAVGLSLAAAITFVRLYTQPTQSSALPASVRLQPAW